MNRRFGNAALATASLVVALLIAVGVDRVVGRFYVQKPQRVGILFPPGSSANYRTMEFDFTVRINNLGFRGDDTTLKSTHASRILVLGDSFTYGWGVDLDETWIRQIERALRREGHDAEVLNLGVPGYNPYQYADTAEEAVPLLKPDIVLVELLQADDLRQLDQYVPDESPAASTRSRSSGIANALVPNLVELVARRHAAVVSGLNERSEARWKFFNGVWERQANEKIESLDQTRRAVFDSWPENIRDSFRSGELNPGLLTLDLVWGRPDVEELDVASPLMQTRIARCVDALSRIRSVAERNGARVIAVSIPRLEYVVPSVWSELSHADRVVTQRMLITDAPDVAARQACERAGIRIVVLTEQFRRHEHREKFYFPYDLHLNSQGQQFFAELLAPELAGFVSED